MRSNPLRQLLNEGKPTLGTHVISPWPGMIELVGNSGAFDYIEYVGEYSPISLEGMDNIGRALVRVDHIALPNLVAGRRVLWFVLCHLSHFSATVTEAKWIHAKKSGAARTAP